MNGHRPRRFETPRLDLLRFAEPRFAVFVPPPLLLRERDLPLDFFALRFAPDALRAARAARAPTTPPTIAPTGPAILPTTTPAAAPATSLRIVGNWMLSD